MSESLNEIFLQLIMPLVVGLLLGVFFFGALHWTLRRYLSSPYAGVLFTASLFLRVGLTVAGFYFVGQGQWQRILACLLGFVFARAAVFRFTRVKERTPQVDSL